MHPAAGGNALRQQWAAERMKTFNGARGWLYARVGMLLSPSA